MTATILDINEIDRYRRLLNVTQRALCEAADVSVHTYSRTKLKRTQPNLKTLRRLSDALSAFRHQPGTSPEPRNNDAGTLGRDAAVAADVGAGMSPARPDVSDQRSAAE